MQMFKKTGILPPYQKKNKKQTNKQKQASAFYLKTIRPNQVKGHLDYFAHYDKLVVITDHFQPSVKFYILWSDDSIAATVVAS